LRPRASAGARAQNSCSACRLRSRQRRRACPALAEEGNDAVGELAEGHGVERSGVEPVDDERAVAADPIEALARRSFCSCVGGIKNEGRLLDFFAGKSVADFGAVDEDFLGADRRRAPP
jgi:hypothetical protein